MTRSAISVIDGRPLAMEGCFVVMRFPFERLLFEIPYFQTLLHHLWPFLILLCHFYPLGHIFQTALPNFFIKQPSQITHVPLI